MNLETEYLGLKLPHPIMPGASPLVDSLDTVRALEDAGAAAIVMHSLFEEQIIRDQWSTHQHQAVSEGITPEASTFFPEQEDYMLGPEEYLATVQRLKETVDIPVIASLNGSSMGGWVDYARLIEQAGADALEINTYHVATNPEESGADLENRTIEILRNIRSAVEIPLAVKLSPYFSSLPHFAREIQALGAEGIVLFNRFFVPDIDIEELEMKQKLQLSNSTELRLRLRWLAILRPQLECSLACSGGVHRATDVIKSVMAGADAVQCVAVLLHEGDKRMRSMIDGLREWMEEHEYESLTQMKGSMSLRHCPDPAAYVRANYLQTLQLWKV